MENKRNFRIDALKAIAIIAVVLYHFGGGYLEYGYLGVDIFFVISGYFMMKTIAKAMRNDAFSYWGFVIDKIVRLWPLVLLWGAIALVIGIFTMLPDDFENLSESVIASNVFANNILSCITTKNYWDVVNKFKPLMHTWYVGILMQAYVVLPLIYIGAFKLAKGKTNGMKVTVAVITLLSLVAYLLPLASTAEKFYYLPFRAFEITLGSMLAFAPEKNISDKAKYIIETVCLAIILILLCVNKEYMSSSMKLLLMVGVSAILVYIFTNTHEKSNGLLKAFSYIGKASLSIYLCHQVIVAYMFYAVTDSTDAKALLAFSVIVAAASAACYLLVEKPLGKIGKKKIWQVLIPSIALFLITSAVAGLIYMHAGVVRDVPELGIDKTNIHRGMHAEYCDVPYSWDRDFESTDKTKVVVIGNSFGRDWANILNESAISNKIEISYIFPPSDDVYEAYKERLQEADVVFRAFSSDIVDIEEYLPDDVPSEKLYVVGFKNFGSSNGIIYAHRNSDDYFEQSINLSADALSNNQILQERYGEHYIDLITPVQNEDGSIRVFTDDQHYISQDCRHLTQYGAKYYSRILDLEWIIGMKK